jgi:hypothetical protein
MCCVALLGKLNAAELAKHVAALVDRLDDSDDQFPKAVLDALVELDAAELPKHAAALLEPMRGSEWQVCEEVLDNLGKLEAAKLVKHAAALSERQDDSSYFQVLGGQVAAGCAIP